MLPLELHKTEMERSENQNHLRSQPPQLTGTFPARRNLFCGPAEVVHTNGGRKMAKMSNTDNRVSRSWPATILSLIAAVGLTIGAIALWSSEHEIWAAIVGLFALSFTAMATQWRNASCPHCGASMTLPGGMRRCASCGQYAQIQEGRIVPVGAGVIADKPFFEVKIAPLLKAGKLPTEWNWPRPDTCCVCGKLATGNCKVDF